MQNYKLVGNKGLFDEQENMSKLSVKGNHLDLSFKVIDFEIFRDLLESNRIPIKKQCRLQTLRCSDDIQNHHIALLLRFR